MGRIDICRNQVIFTYGGRGGGKILKHILGLILVVMLLFSFGATALATPVTPKDAGQFFVFGDYDDWYYEFQLGVGYAVTDNFTLGVFYGLGWPTYGAFAELSFDPFVITGEVANSNGNLVAQVRGLYLFDLDPITFWVGLGMDLGDWGNYLFAEAAANIPLGDSFSVYGSVDYYFHNGYIGYRAGLALAF